MGVALAAGVAAQIAQVVALREVWQVARGGEAVLGLALAAWLLGGALGARLGGGGVGRAAALVVALPVVALVVSRLLPVTTGSWAPAAALLSAPAAFAPAAFFGAVLRRAEPARALALEAVGAAAAGALLTFLLLEFVPALALLLLAGALCLAVSGRRVAAVAVAVAAGFAPSVEGALHARRAGGLWPGAELQAVVESPYGRLCRLARGPQTALYVDGRLALTLPAEVDAEAYAQVVLAAHPDPRRVLVLGLPGLVLLPEIVRHGVAEITWVVDDAHALALLRPVLPPVVAAALARVDLRVGDPRRLAGEGEHDVVMVLAPPPGTLGDNRFYTEEFFRAVSLADGGLCAVALPAAPNEAEREVRARNVSVARAMVRLDYVVLPGVDDVLLAGRPAPDVDPAVLEARLDARGVALVHHAQDFFAEEFAPERVRRATEGYRRYPQPVAPPVPFAVEATTRGPLPPDTIANRDLFPAAVLHTAAALAREEEAVGLAGAVRVARFAPLALLVPALAWLGLAWRRERARGPLVAATTGAATMGLWIVLLLGYQARVGALYGDLALLAAAFMAGFAGGTRLRLPLWQGELCLIGIALAMPGALRMIGRGEAVALAAVLGALGGWDLARVVVLHRARAARLYAADLLGAGAAALVAGGFLLPALGAMATCASWAALKALSLVAVLRGRLH